MESQNYDSADAKGIDRLLDEADERIEQLRKDRAALAERRRALVEPRYKTVLAEPREAHNKFALGGVLTALGLSGLDADALAGLLASNADQAMADMDEVIDRDPFMTLGTAMIAVLDIHDRDLTARGLHETWRRRLAIYEQDRAEWLALDAEYRMDGMWREADMTRHQRWLIRVTCRLRAIDVPGHLSRGDAADWLDTHGANMNYREFSS